MVLIPFYVSDEAYSAGISLPRKGIWIGAIAVGPI
tara:strand:- start:329 stop:433 length:105 start_codon:yes stop_codon:yes gene_type:complete